MSFAPALAVLGLFSFTLGAAQAADGGVAAAKSVAEASKRLEEARSNLASAVKKIEKDPPANADLEAAHRAVEALRDALEAGAGFETSDLDYARSVLAGRKELRTQRDYVDQRRANIHIHELRRTMDGAIAAMNDKASKVTGAKEPGQKEFDEARAAMAAVKKQVEDGKQWTRQDPKFGAFLAETEAAIAKHDRSIGDKWLQLSADKQRGLLDEARKDLAATIAELGKGFSDTNFAASDKAVKALEKRLEEGKPLEEKDKGYKSDADKARGELAQAKKKMDESVAQAGVARIKAEIDPAYSELKNSAKNIRGRRPPPEALAEAKTAAFVVRKLMEKYEGQGARSPEIGKYINEVKEALVDVEVTLQIKALENAKSDATSALRALNKRVPSDEEFADARLAIDVLEKTLATVHQKHPSISAQATDAKIFIKDQRTIMERRRYEVDLTLQKQKVSDARKAALEAVQAVQKDKASDEQLKAAEDKVKEIQATLDAGAAFVKKDRDYAAYAKESKDKQTEFLERIARRRIQLQAADAKAALTELVGNARAKLEAAKVPSSSDAELEAAQKAVDDIIKALEAKAPLEAQEPGYMNAATRAQNDLIKLSEQLEFANQARAIRRMTGEALAAGDQAVGAAGASNDLKKKKELFESALAKFKACQDGGAKMLRDNVKLANVEVLVGGQPSTPRDVMTQCQQRWEATQDPLKQVLALIRFEEGPKKAYESAKYLLSSSRNKEAIAQLDECIATGRIVENRYPELKDRKFGVGGAQLTLAELIQTCVKQRKQLQQ